MTFCIASHRVLHSPLLLRCRPTKSGSPTYPPSPQSFALLTDQQRADLAGLVTSWKSAYSSYFTPTSKPPAALAFEQALQASPTPATPIVDSFKSWLASNGVPSYGLPASSAQAELISQLQSLQSLGSDLVNTVLASVDGVRLSTEFALVNSDVTIGSSSFSEYAANGGAIRVLVPQWVAVLMDPSVATSLTPTPATTSSSPLIPAPSTSLESTTAPNSAPVSLITSPASRDDLRISVSQASPSADGRALVFTLTRSGYLTETTRVAVNTTGYVDDHVPSVQGQIVFAPDETSKQVVISLMRQLPQEQASVNSADTSLSSDITLHLDLLPAGSNGPRSTSVMALNAIDAYTPELDSPSRNLDPSLLQPASLFASNLAVQLPTALWFNAKAINNDPIRFGLDVPQGAPLNDIQLLDRLTGKLVSVFGAAAAGDAVIYGDDYLSPSTDLYFSVTDGGRFDQDGEANGEITIAADGALTSPGTLLLGNRVLRAPSTSGMNLRLTLPSAGFKGNLAPYATLLLIAADDTNGGIHQADGTTVLPSDGDAYLAALAARTASDAPLLGPCVASGSTALGRPSPSTC
jgi:hypothetical protein